MSRCKVVAIANQKGGTGKTTTAASLGVALAMSGKRVLLIDADPQGDLTASLGWRNPDELETTLATHLEAVARDEPLEPDAGILKHPEGVDLMPANIELSGTEVALVTAMNRERTLKAWLDEAKRGYDYALIDCMPSLGMLARQRVGRRRFRHRARAGAVSSREGHDPARQDDRAREAADQPTLGNRGRAADAR